MIHKGFCGTLIVLIIPSLNRKKKYCILQFLCSRHKLECTITIQSNTLVPDIMGRF